MGSKFEMGSRQVAWRNDFTMSVPLSKKRRRLKSGDGIVQNTSRRPTDCDYNVEWLLSSMTEKYVKVGA